MSSNYSTAEQTSQVAEQMQLAAFERYESLSRNLLYVLALVLLLGLVWAALSESDVCAEAVGRIEPRTRLQTMRPTADGTIYKYFVHDGDIVKKDQDLLWLNTVRAEAELTKRLQELSILDIQLKEHENARDGLAMIIANPRYHGKTSLSLPEVDRIAGQLFASKKSLDSALYDMSVDGGSKGLRMSPQMTLLKNQEEKLKSVQSLRIESVESKAAEREAERRKLESRVTMLESAFEKARRQLGELELSLADAKKEMEIYDRGRKLGVASEVKYLDVQSYMHQREFLVAQQRMQVRDLEQQLSAAKVDLNSSGLAYIADSADLVAGVKAEEQKVFAVPLSMNDAARALQNKQAAFDVADYHARARYSKELTEISNLQKKLTETNAAITVLKEQLAEKHLRAPVDGSVSDLLQLLPGETVLRGQALMNIVPADKELVLRAEVNNTDVGFVELGQSVRLRVDAFPCEEFGVIPGKVIRVDEFPEEKLEAQKRISVYKVTIKPLRTFLQAGSRRCEIKPGLEVHADIVLRKRTMLQLFFEPLLKMGGPV